jgi:hypothetical protein
LTVRHESTVNSTGIIGLSIDSVASAVGGAGAGAGSAAETVADSDPAPETSLESTCRPSQTHIDSIIPASRLAQRVPFDESKIEASQEECKMDKTSNA